MSTTDPNWSDDSFDTLDDGFLPRQPKIAEPVSSYQSPVPPPPMPRPPHSGSARRVVALLLLFFLTAVGLIVTWVVREPQPQQTGPAVTSNSRKPEAVPAPSGTAVEKEMQVEQSSVQPRQTVAAAQSTQRESTPEPAVEPIANAEKKPESPVVSSTPPAPQPTTRSSVSTSQEWCVQVFASTSPDDADEWNNRLRKKNVDDSRIEMIERQGQLWYRVRFGRFGSRQEAEQVAQSMGFRNAWVNRAR